MKAKIVRIIESSTPSCGLPKECWTKCGECGAERVKAEFLAWLYQHGSKTQVQLFNEEWNNG